MPITVYRDIASEAETHESFDVSYRVHATDDVTGADVPLSSTEAYDAAALQSVADYSETFARYNMRRVSFSVMDVALSWRLIVDTSGLRNLQGKNPDPYAGPYPTITHRLQTSPPRPVQRTEALAVIKAYDANGVDVTSSTAAGKLTAMRRHDSSELAIPVAPPAPNRVMEVTFEGVIPTWYRSLIANVTGKQNGDAISVGGETFPAGHLMLASALLVQQSSGPEQIVLSYFGAPDVRTVSTLGSPISVAPLSHVSIYKSGETVDIAGKSFDILAPQLYIEQRQFDEAAYAGVFDGVEPS